MLDLIALTRPWRDNESPHLFSFRGGLAMSTEQLVARRRRRLGLIVTGLGAGIAAAALFAGLFASAKEYWQDMNDRSH